MALQAIVGTGYFFTFYDITDTGFAIPQVQTQFHLSGNESTFLALRSARSGTPSVRW